MALKEGAENGIRRPGDVLGGDSYRHEGDAPAMREPVQPKPDVPPGLAVEARQRLEAARRLDPRAIFVDLGDVNDARLVVTAISGAVAPVEEVEVRALPVPPTFLFCLDMEVPDPFAWFATVGLDLTRVLSGPYCTMLLGDLGARVIKIERPGTGDLSRTSIPDDPGGLDNPVFHSLNRNKRSIALDLKSLDDAIFTIK